VINTFWLTERKSGVNGSTMYNNFGAFSRESRVRWDCPTMRAGGLGGMHRTRTAVSAIAFFRFVSWSSHQAANTSLWALNKVEWESLEIRTKLIKLDEISRHKH